MYLLNYTPITNGSRFKKRITSYGSLKKKFYPLTTHLKKNSGRNIKGFITVRGRGCKLKKNFINLDCRRTWSNDFAVCVDFVKTSNRSSLLALIKYSNGTFSYILASGALKLGSYTFTTINPVKFMKIRKFSCCNILLKFVKYSYTIFNVEPFLNIGGKYAKSAGVFCKIINIDLLNKFIKIKLPSGKYKFVSIFCFASLGRVSNMWHYKEHFSNAGYYRNIGFRPKTRGVAKNPVDHPHGGRTKTNSPTLTPWGKIAKRGK